MRDSPPSASGTSAGLHGLHSLHSLPVLLRLHGRPVILAGTGEAAAAKRRLLERTGAIIVSPDDTSARLAIVAIEDDHEAAEVIAMLKARGVLVNATDRPRDCDFTLPAIIERGPVLVAIGTGGVSAGLAKALRQRLEAMFPQSLGTLANGLSAARQRMRERWPDAADRRRAIDAALSEHGPLDPLRENAAEALPDWLAAGSAATPTGFVTLWIDDADPDQLRLAQARYLGQADRIFHHPDVPLAILRRARADAEVISSHLPPQIAQIRGLTLWLDWGKSA